MKIITLKDGSVEFMPEEYIGSLLNLVESQMGEDTRCALEEWVEFGSPTPINAAALANEMEGLKKYVSTLSDALRKEKEDHLRDVADLEEEMQRLATANEMLFRVNEELSRAKGMNADSVEVKKGNIPDIVSLVVQSSGCTASALVSMANLGPNAITRWRHGHYMPKLYEFLSLLEAAGWELRIEKVGQ
ncbi:MAG: hypothetical protein IKY91_04825 [Akkermansia sp.]|nr:hypothetical protein [Akkermansia sp.]